jgi:ABC-type iron transport system FetAB ATPase subunit
MQGIDLVVETTLDLTPRVQQLSGMFDVPAQEKLTHHWKGKVPLADREWNVGLIVGPSGAGKSTVAHKLFDVQSLHEWQANSIIDDFDQTKSIEDIAAVCSAVGFNTIPSWMKPYNVLSTGEKFRAGLARHLLEDPDPIVVDEFSSVVDRQVAQIASHAVQKYVRKYNRKFVAITCHYDVIEWLQPDWMLEPASMSFTWRSLQRRPELQAEIARVHHSAWPLFAPFHYLTASLAKAAKCYILFVNEVPVTFCGILHRPAWQKQAQNVWAISRIVTLPDYQGLGLAMIIADTLGAAHKAIGWRLRNYPAHPSFVRAHDHSPNWWLRKKPGTFGARPGKRSAIDRSWKQGARPCAIFEYCGPAMADKNKAQALLT